MKVIEFSLGVTHWYEARTLRYDLFFREKGLPESVLDDEVDEKSRHFGIHGNGKLMAYCRLTPIGNNQYAVSQMVVDMTCQRSGYGTLLLKRMIHEASLKNADALELNARLTAVAFYSKHGFVEIGEVFNSKLTDVPHVKMLYWLTE